MKRYVQSPLVHRSMIALFAVAVLAAPIALSACDKDQNTSKTTTTKTTETPDGTKRTTETTEKKVETERKNP